MSSRPRPFLAPRPGVPWRDFVRFWPTTLLLGLLRLLALLPISIGRAIGGGLGMLMYAANAKRRRIARINLALCFPALDDNARERLLRRHYRDAGRAYLDIGWFAWGSKRRLTRAMQVDGLAHVTQALAAGRRVILLAPHCVGMNIGGMAVAQHYPVFSMVKPQRNPVINWLLDRARARYDSPLIQRDQGLRPVVRGLKAGWIFYYLPDEDFGPKHSVFAPFFGVPTATLTTLGRLASLTDAVVLPCFARLSRAGYAITVAPPLADFPTGDEGTDAARMNQALEAGIRAAPEQYMWTFKLFKTRPAGAASPYV